MSQFRSLVEALQNAERIREELPHLIQPEQTSYDIVTLAEEIKRLEPFLHATGSHPRWEYTSCGKSSYYPVGIPPADLSDNGHPWQVNVHRFGGRRIKNTWDIEEYWMRPKVEVK